MAQPLAGDCGYAPLLLVSRRLSRSTGTVSWRLSDPNGAIKNAPGLAARSVRVSYIAPLEGEGIFLARKLARPAVPLLGDTVMVAPKPAGCQEVRP